MPRDPEHRVPHLVLCRAHPGPVSGLPVTRAHVPLRDGQLRAHVCRDRTGRAESEFRDVDSGIFTNALLTEGADGNEWIANEDNSTPVIGGPQPAQSPATRSPAAARRPR